MSQAWAAPEAHILQGQRSGRQGVHSSLPVVLRPGFLPPSPCVIYFPLIYPSSFTLNYKAQSVNLLHTQTGHICTSVENMLISPFSPLWLPFVFNRHLNQKYRNSPKYWGESRARQVRGLIRSSESEVKSLKRLMKYPSLQFNICQRTVVGKSRVTFQLLQTV